MSPRIHPQALSRILSQIRFGTILNIAGSLANPSMPRYGVRGVHSRDLIEPVTRVMREIGYIKAIVFHGSSGNGSKGMDEISSLGETDVTELGEDGGIVTYTITPEDIGLQRPSTDTISPAMDRGEEAIRFLRILSGRDRGPRYDIVCLNAAPIWGPERGVPAGAGYHQFRPGNYQAQGVGNGTKQQPGGRTEQAGGPARRKCC